MGRKDALLRVTGRTRDETRSEVRRSTRQAREGDGRPKRTGRDEEGKGVRHRWWDIKDVRGKNCEALCRIFNKAGSEEED